MNILSRSKGVKRSGVSQGARPVLVGDDAGTASMGKGREWGERRGDPEVQVGPLRHPT